MTDITKNNNIFGILLDNLTMLIYNDINIIVILRKMRRAFLIIFAAAAMLCFVSAEKIESGADGRVLSVSLEAVEADGGIGLKIVFPEGVGFCGFYGEINFSEGLEFSSFECCSELPLGGVPSYAASEGRIAFLLDGDGGIFDGEELLFEFLFTGEDFCEFLFELERGEAYFWDDGRLLRLEVPLASAVFTVEGYGSEGEQSGGGKIPVIVGAGDFGGCLGAVCSIPDGCFAVGFEAVAVSVPDAELSRYTVAVVVPVGGRESFFKLPLGLPSVGRFCVNIRPVAYYGSGAVFGDPTVMLFIDGILYGE